MKYDFIEIGTSNFATLIEKATNETVGISIEPIKYYLNQLPDKLKVRKLNCAISKDNEEGLAEVYYVPESIIKKHNLPEWLKGCNSVNEYHMQHSLLNVKHLVKKDKIKSLPIAVIFKHFDVTELDFLKIDTEGQDTHILSHLANNLLLWPKTVYPKKILFESNSLVSPEQVLSVIVTYKELGYTVKHSDHDTLLELQATKA